MKTPKTIRGYIALIKKIERIIPTLLKGYDKLSAEDAQIINALDMEISNLINELTYSPRRR